MDDKHNGDSPGGPRPSPGTSLHPGSLLSHTYEIVTLVGRGGMGEVYRARHRHLGSEHAIKIILPDLASDERVVGLFKREAQVLRRLRHEAVVSYDGLFSDEHGRVYLAMEFVDGPSLKDVLKAGALKPGDVRMLRDRLAAGLAAAHDTGVVHRDLSPDNVILPDSRLDLAKIIDFGIAKRTDPEKSTIIGSQFAGKYSYASPEQFGMYGGDVGPKSDIYSLGLVLAAAASGKALPMGTSTIEVVEARRQVPDLTALPGELRREIAPLLEPDPKNRPASMHDVIGLGRRPPGKPGAARRPAAGADKTAQASRGGGRRAAMAMVAVLVLAGAGGGGWWYWQQSQRADRQSVLAAIDRSLDGHDCARLTRELGDDGTAVISGRIGSEAEREALLERIAAIDGVTRVQEYLAIWPCDGAPAIDREAIHVAVAQAVAAFACTDLSATVANDGTVRLAGRIGSEADLDRLRRRVAAVGGVAGVEGNVTIEPCPEDDALPALQAEVDGVLDGFACADLSASVEADGRVRLFGSVGDREDFDALQAAVAAIQGVTAIDNAVAIQPCEPSAPDRATVAAAVDRAVAAVACGEVEASVAEDLAVGLSGWIGSAGQARALETSVGAIEGVNGVVADWDFRPCLPGDFRRETVTAEIGTIVGGLSCAGVSAELTADLRVAVSGYVGSQRDRRRLQNQLAALDHVTRVDGDVAVHPWPLCEAMGLVGGDASIRIVANNPDGIYREGETLVVDVTVPRFDGFLYVDYFDNQGNVIHMLPSPVRPENTVSAGEQVTIGDGDGRTYRIRPPLGTSMILAVMSPQKLFPLNRTEVEHARDYLTDLRRSLERVNDGPGPDAAVQFLMLTLQPA